MAGPTSIAVLLSVFLIALGLPAFSSALATVAIGFNLARCDPSASQVFIDILLMHRCGSGLFFIIAAAKESAQCAQNFLQHVLAIICRAGRADCFGLLIDQEQFTMRGPRGRPAAGLEHESA